MSAASVRCPRCSATVAGESGWCSLCYADLRPAPAPVAETPAPEPSAPPRRGRHARPEPLPPAVQPLDAATAARGHAGGDLDADARVAAMLAQLAAEPRTPIDGVLRRFEDPTTRIALMVGGTFALMLLLFAVYFVAGLLLG